MTFSDYWATRSENMLKDMRVLLTPRRLLTTLSSRAHKAATVNTNSTFRQVAPACRIRKRLSTHSLSQVLAAHFLQTSACLCPADVYLYHVSAFALQQKPKKVVWHELDSSWSMHTHALQQVFPMCVFFFFGGSVTGSTCFVRNCNLLEKLRLGFICPT